MTRTERSSYPRAINKDRSESRSGLNNGIRKGGAGGHNWGSLADEIEYEATDMREEEYEGEAGEEEEAGAGASTTVGTGAGAGAEGGERKLTEGANLTDIARSSGGGAVNPQGAAAKEVEVTRDAPTATLA